MSLYPIYFDTQDFAKNMNAIIHSNIKEAQRKADCWFALSDDKTGVVSVDNDIGSLGTSSIIPYMPTKENQKINKKNEYSIRSVFQDNFDTGSELNDIILNSLNKSIHPSLLISDLGWSRKKAMETRMRLISFEEDWDAPGMKLYDYL